MKYIYKPQPKESNIITDIKVMIALISVTIICYFHMTTIMLGISLLFCFVIVQLWIHNLFIMPVLCRKIEENIDIYLQPDDILFDKVSFSIPGDFSEHKAFDMFINNSSFEITLVFNKINYSYKIKYKDYKKIKSCFMIKCDIITTLMGKKRYVIKSVTENDNNKIKLLKPRSKYHD